MKPRLRELIPVLIVFVFIVTAAALVLEILVATASGRTSDGAATTALGAVLTACVPALVALYLRDSVTPPNPPEDGPEVDARLERESREAIRKYLDRIMGWRPKWMPST